MPARNGLRLIQDLRALDEGFPIIAMSGTNADQLQMAEDFGANAVLYKPLSVDMVLGAVNRLLSDASPDIWAQSLGLRSHGV
jgi:CheY-like chemotaxis protein